MKKVLPVNSKVKNTFFKTVYRSNEWLKGLAQFLLGISDEICARLIDLKGNRLLPQRKELQNMKHFDKELSKIFGITFEPFAPAGDAAVRKISYTFDKTIFVSNLLGFKNKSFYYLCRFAFKFRNLFFKYLHFFNKIIYFYFISKVFIGCRYGLVKLVCQFNIVFG